MLSELNLIDILMCALTASFIVLIWIVIVGTAQEVIKNYKRRG